MKEVARRLAESERTVYKLISDGKLASLVIGDRARRVSSRQLDRFIAERELHSEELRPHIDRHVPLVRPRIGA